MNLAAIAAGQNAYKAQQDTLAPVVSNQQAQAAITQSQRDIAQQQALANQLAQQQGIQNQSNVFNQQQGLANQLQAMSEGQGPNPAQAQLNNSTGQNISQQAALMAGQRGAGANAGLIARQAGQQGAGIQQQAAGQAAAMRAQQQLGAISALQGQQQILGQTAGQQAGQQINATNSAAQLAQQQQNALLGQNQFQQGLSLQNFQGQQQINAGIQAQNTQNAMNTSQGLVKGAAAAGIFAANPAVGAAVAPALLKAEGGEIPQMNSNPILKENYSGAKSKVGQHFAQGGKVHNMKRGGHVPGKAKVPGPVNSYANDTVDAKLSPGEIVLPNSVTKSKEPVKAAAKFVAAIKSKKGRK